MTQKTWDELRAVSPGRYVLQGTEPVPEPDLLAWAAWFETADRRVAWTEVAPGLEISTIFLGLDYGWLSPVPLLFETMVFRDGDGAEGERYATWHDAEQGHKTMVDLVQGTPPAPPRKDS